MANSKQLVMDALVNKPVDRIPWVPFVGCHAAKLLNVSAEDYFKSVDLIVEGARKAKEMYRPDGLPVLFDLQIEAEAMGCGVKFADENPPAVFAHPMEEGKTLADFKVPSADEGRFPVALEATRRLVAEMGDDIALYGLITGPLTLALHLRGTDIFFDMVDCPEDVLALMNLCEEVCKATAKMYMDAGVDIIAVVDPMTSQISPANFRDFVTPACTNIFSFIRENGKGGSFFVCGNAKRNIEEMCLCKPDNISIDENIPLDYVKEVASRYGVSTGGNIQLTVTMLLGTPADNINDAANCCAIGGKQGFILAPGCDMPFGVPPVNVQAVAAYVHGEDADFLANNANVGGFVPEWDKPDYANYPKVIVNVVTLDSECCAPCQYMMEAVKQAAQGLDDVLEFHEHKVKTPDGVGAMIALGVKHIPTITVEGEVKYSSIIPGHDELRATFESALKAKNLG